MRSPTPQAELEVSIAGRGLAPADVPIDQLSELLAATTDLLLSIEAEFGADRVLPSLVKVKKGSAKYVFRSARRILGYHHPSFAVRG